MGILAMTKKAATPLDQWSLIQTILPVKYYTTAIIFVGNIVSCLMSIGAVYLLYRITEKLFGRRAGLFASALLVFNASFNYYSHTSNLDVPYIFWGLFALHYLLRAMETEEKRDYIKCAVMTLLCFGTKDQGYALFVLPFIIYLIIIPVSRGMRDSRYRSVFFRNFMVFAAVFTVGFVVVENLILNWTGFVERVKIMTGSNSEGYTPYATSWAGYAALLHDSIPVYMHQIASWPVAALSVLGLALCAVRERKNRAAALLPFVSALSFVLFFVLVVKRADHRFMLAPSVLMTVYAGYLLAWAYDRISRKAFFWAAAAPLAAYLLIFVLNVNVNLLCDARYGATRWMAQNLPSGAIVEHYEDYVYLPQFPANVREYRIKKDFGAIDKRNPDYVIISSKWYKRFFIENIRTDEAGKKTSDRDAKFESSDQGSFIRALMNGRLGYEKAQTFVHTVPAPFTPDYVTEETVILKRKKTL